jgi:hypothetical protein
VELWREATRLLEPLAATTPPEAQTPWEPDSARGTIRRQLWRTTEIAGWNGWGHLAQVWLVHRQRPGGRRKPMAWQLLFDDVLFALRLPAAVLSPRPPA